MLLLSISWPSVLSPFKDAALTDAGVAPLVEFRCRDAHCFKATDRAVVLKAIRDEWESEEAFDAYVSKELPDILAESKRQCEWLTPETQAALKHNTPVPASCPSWTFCVTRLTD